MIAHLAVRARAARAAARIHAVAVAARHVAATIGMIEALAAMAVVNRIATVAGRTGAHRTAADRLLTQGVHTARIAGATLG